MHPFFSIALPVVLVELAATVGTAFIYWALKSEERKQAIKENGRH